MFLARFNLTLEDNVTKLAKTFFISGLRLANVLNFLEMPITDRENFEAFFKKNAKKSVNSCLIQSIITNFNIKIDSKVNTSWVEVETLEQNDKSIHQLIGT